jgi:hypothetical protein
MDSGFCVWLNKELQIIEQRAQGDITYRIFEDICRKIDNCVTGLDNPSQIRILIDSRMGGKLDFESRKASLKMLARPDLYRLALWGANAFSRVIIRFLIVLSPVKTAARLPRSAPGNRQ